MEKTTPAVRWFYLVWSERATLPVKVYRCEAAGLAVNDGTS